MGDYKINFGNNIHGVSGTVVHVTTYLSKSIVSIYFEASIDRPDGLSIRYVSGLQPDPAVKHDDGGQSTYTCPIVNHALGLIDVRATITTASGLIIDAKLESISDSPIAVPEKLTMELEKGVFRLLISDNIGYSMEFGLSVDNIPCITRSNDAFYTKSRVGYHDLNIYRCDWVFSISIANTKRCIAISAKCDGGKILVAGKLLVEGELSK